MVSDTKVDGSRISEATSLLNSSLYIFLSLVYNRVPRYG